MATRDDFWASELIMITGIGLFVLGSWLCVLSGEFVGSASGERTSERR